jgi:hypothetical protein
MKLSTSTRVLVVLLATALAGLAAGIDGKWEAEMEGRGGQTIKQTYTFKAEGDKLSGNVAGMRGETPITDGKISGDDVSFAVVRNFQGNEFRQEFKGKLAGDELRLSFSFGDQTREIVAKRVK